MACPCTKSQLLSISQIQSLLRQAGWPENLIAKYSAVVWYESCGGCPTASNKVGEYSIGLLQMNMKAHGTSYGTEAQLYDPLWNLKQAYKLYNIQGDRAWVNSVKKYNNNFQGVAQQARNIYNQGGSNAVIVTANQVPSVLNNTNNPLPQNLNDKTSVYAVLGIVGVVLLASRI